MSFAPEATLHTWNVVEMPEDSTTSSASSNSTRRASGITTRNNATYLDHASPVASDGSEPPSTPPEQVEDVQVAQSPSHQRDVHQKKRRRSSTVPAIGFNEPSDIVSSPISSESEDDTGSQAFETAEEGSESSDSDDDDHVEDETETNIDEENTINSSSSTASSGRLDAALQQAAKQAGTQGIGYDEHGDLTMEMADDEVTEAFQPWVVQGKSREAVGDPSALLDQENVNPFSPAFKANVMRRAEEQGEGATMDMTQAVGGILPQDRETRSSPKNKRRKSVAAPNRRRSSIARRRSSGDASAYEGDQTMDLTTAIGGIEGASNTNDESLDDAEELTMELTTVVGGLVRPQLEDSPQKIHAADRRDSSGSMNEDEEMEFTQAAGGILPSITERTEPPDDQTMEMDVTTAIGSILPDHLNARNKDDAKALMEAKADTGHLAAASPFHDGSPQRPMGAGLLDERPLPAQARNIIASETGSPSVTAAHNRSSARKSVGLRKSLTPKSQQPTPVKKPATPSKQLTPKPSRPLTPGKTPPPKNIAMRSASPKKLFEVEINFAKEKEDETTPSTKGANPLFNHDPVTGVVTPSVVLKPRRRRSSGLGIDREGLGSPRVTALLDRRASIGESAKTFASHGVGSSGVRFEDPLVLDQEIDQERAEEMRRESGVVIMQTEANDQDLDEPKDATSNLKGMIQSLSPKKNKLKGRKSLHVGTAKGLLGKRPAELDEDEDEDATPKKLKGREGSPVKKVKLPAPPNKPQTTGRITRSTRRSLTETSGNPQSKTQSGAADLSEKNLTPKDQSRSKDVEVSSPAKVLSFERKVESMGTTAKPVEEDQRMHLHDFLHLTGIRFMDQLTTTKRRHTMAPNAHEAEGDITIQRQSHFEAQDASNELESCVVAGACTIPMLELYQHVSILDRVRSSLLTNHL